MKTLPLPPYHLFHCRGQPFAFDIRTGLVLRLDDAAFALLAAEAPDDGPAPASGGTGAREARHELDLLRSQGILTGPIEIPDHRDDVQYVDRLLPGSINSLTLSVAQACNLRCRYCYIAANGALANGLMSEETARQAVDFLFAHSSKDRIGITFFGGEPLLNQAVIRFVVAYSQKVAAAAGRKVGYSVTTNATLLSGELLDFMLAHRFGIMVSMDGPRDVHDRARPFADGAGSFDTAVRNVRGLLARGRSVNARCTLSNLCLNQLRIVQALEEIGFRKVTITPSWGRAREHWPFDIGPQENDYLRRQDDFFMDRLLDQLAQGRKVRFDPWAKAVRAIHTRAHPRLPCGVGRGTLTAGVDGSLYPCHRYVGEERYRIGDVRQGLDRSRLAAYFKTYFQSRDRCDTCWAVKLCQRVCPWHVTQADGQGHSPSDWLCASLRTWYEQGMWLYDVIRRRYPWYLAEVAGGGRVRPKRPGRRHSQVDNKLGREAR
ncbi:MAG: radical SAM protein [Thermodesulfobacteriota bacterium]